MDKLCIEGVIIYALAFQEYDRIISVFSPQEGLVKLFVKGALHLKNGQGSTTAPLTCIEAMCTKGRSDLYSCRELSVLDAHLGLRQQLKTLEAACDMLQAILSTQLPGKAAPELYQLFLTYLKRLPTAAHPLAVSVSFRLKTLRYEGLLDFTHDELALSPDEQQLIQELAFSRDFPQLASRPIETSLALKIKSLFDV